MADRPAPPDPGPSWRAAAALGPPALPVLAFVAVRLAGGAGAAGTYRAMAFALVASAAVGAFCARSAAVSSLRAVVVAATLGGAAAVSTTEVARGLAAAFLGGSVVLSASGLSALGRRVGAPGVAAGAVAASVLWVAMLGLYWADPLSEHVPLALRRGVRQAVLYVDPVLAASYGAAGHDRLHDPDVYFEVPLASSLIQAPDARTTGLTWTAVGLLSWAAALVGRRRGPGTARPAP